MTPTTKRKTAGQKEVAALTKPTPTFFEPQVLWGSGTAVIVRDDRGTLWCIRENGLASKVAFKT